MSDVIDGECHFNVVIRVLDGGSCELNSGIQEKGLDGWEAFAGIIGGELAD